MVQPDYSPLLLIIFMKLCNTYLYFYYEFMQHILIFLLYLFETIKPFFVTLRVFSRLINWLLSTLYLLCIYFVSQV